MGIIYYFPNALNLVGSMLYLDRLNCPLSCGWGGFCNHPLLTSRGGERRNGVGCEV